MPSRTLTPLELQLLDFAEAHPDLADGRTQAAMRTEFGWRPATYVARLFQLVDELAALEARPQLVHRVQRLRDSKSAQRQSRSFDLAPTA